MVPPLLWQPRRGRRRSGRGLAAAAPTVIIALAVLGASGHTWLLPTTSVVAPSAADGRPPPRHDSPGGMAEALSYTRAAVEPLREQVDSGQLVPKFGKQAQGVVEALAARLGSSGTGAAGVAELQRVADGELEALFLRQLALLRQQLFRRFETGSKRPADAMAEADLVFVAEAKELLRPGSAWSYENERYALRGALEWAFRQQVTLVRERLRQAQAQRSVVDLIAKLQGQIEVLQEKAKGLRAGSPVVISSSYRIPKTPVQLIGRYQQGHGSLELSLSPDKDPANAEAGFVRGLGGLANIGVTATVHM